MCNNPAARKRWVMRYCFGGLNVKFDLQKMSYRDLLDLGVRVKAAIEEKKQAEKSTIKKQVQDLIRQSGFEIDDIVGKTSTKSLKGRKVAAKYCNPKNSDETWTGRGRQPKWLVAELERGRSLDAFLIK